jgi:hypothetical protein
MMISRRDFVKQCALASMSESIFAYAVPPFEMTGLNGMRMVPLDHIVTVASTPGIYHHSAGIVDTSNGLVYVYRTSDQHVASWVNINMARSLDGGRTWRDHRVLSESSYEKDHANWVAPQTNRLADGRIAILVDRGEKHSLFDWPMLSEWQKSDRGMSNWLLTSSDNGRTWAGPRKVDNVGGEPSYIISLSNGSLMYTRTDSAPTDAKKNPSMPWGATYYRSTGVLSDDGGKTFNRTVKIFDDPLIGDCEVGIAEYAPGKILAMSRIGDGGSAFNQPSRIAYSDDFGKTWSKPRLAPIYAHRPCVRPLRGRSSNGLSPLFVSFRNASNGTTGTLAWRFDPEKDYGYQPSSFLWQEDHCRLERDGLHLRTDEGTISAVEFSFYPIEDDDSAGEMEVEMALIDADAYGCNLCCGAWIRFETNRVSLADRPSAGFDLDTRSSHRYRVIYEGQRIKVYVDGTLKLDTPTEGIFRRNVSFGNRRGAKRSTPRRPGEPLKPEIYSQNRSHSIWTSARISIRNRRDHSVEWEWKASSGRYPDQFRRDHLLMVEKNASFIGGNSGYSGWTQLKDGTIVVADYSSTEKNIQPPIARAYRIPESMLP